MEIFAVIGLAMIIGYGIYIYNRIIAAENKAVMAWSSVVTYERKKNVVLPAVEQLTKDFRIAETDLLKTVTALREKLVGLDSDKIQPSALASVETLTRQLQSSLQVTAEAYPELKSAELYQSFIREISEQQADVAAALTIFNRAVEHHNTYIRQFPNSLVNGMFNKRQPIDRFKDSQAEAGFDYKPNL